MCVSIFEDADTIFSQQLNIPSAVMHTQQTEIYNIYDFTGPRDQSKVSQRQFTLVFHVKRTLYSVGNFYV